MHFFYFIIVILAIGLCLVLALEVLFFFLLKNKKPYPIDTFTKPFYTKDETLGWKSYPDLDTKVTGKIDNRILYEAEYKIDSFGKRITPVEPSPLRNRHALFYGCSITFCLNVSQEETMPYSLGKLASEYVPYNFGFPGYGPQQSLARMKSFPIQEEVSEAEGCLIYTFISGHIDRVLGTLDAFHRYARNAPYYFIDSNKNLVRKGSFYTGRPLTTLLFRLLGPSKIRQFFGINYPSKRAFRTTGLNLVFKVVDEMQNIYYKNFPQGQFIFLIYPGEKEYVPRIVSHFSNTRVRVLDYSSLFDPTDPAFHILEEGHPNAHAHFVVAERLAKDLAVQAGNSL